MKCKKHNNEANSICMNCGIALCNECSEVTISGKNCCSSQCSIAINRVEKIANLTLDRATKGAKAASYGSYLLAFIFFGFAIYSGLYGIPFLGWYMGLFSIGMATMGYFYQRSAKTQLSVNNTAE